MATRVLDSVCVGSRTPAVLRDETHYRSTDEVLIVKALSPGQWRDVAILVDDIAVDPSAKRGTRVDVGSAIE